jgi:hypothetical protein
VVLIGAIIGGAAAEYWYRTRGAVPAAAQESTGSGSLAALQADVEHLKSVVPTQSHTMTDVGYHWANLWFAAQHKNWPLARFFFNEARQHVRWTILIRPVRKGPDGQPVDIKAIFDGIDASSFAAVDIAIGNEDAKEFETEYKVALETCYACHKAAGLPHLRPMIPTAPPTTVINFDPKAAWPQ